MRNIILASASPRRRELLRQAGVSFRIVPAMGEEKAEKKEPSEYVQELSFGKAEEVAEREEKELSEGALIIGADTVVVYSGRILGKPENEEDAVRMLERLQGHTHQVYTGVTLLLKEKTGWQRRSFSECTDVAFCPVSEEEIRLYVSTGEPMDKAGSYAIQGKWGKHVKEIQGDYNNVVGLPVDRLMKEAEKMGISLCEEQKPVKACIFDLDGTLADTLSSMAVIGNKVMNHFGLSSLPLDNYRYYCGDGASMLIRRCLADAGDPELSFFSEADRMYRKLFNEDPLFQVTQYEGMEETLKKMKQNGLRLAVCTNKPHPAALKVIEALYGNLFDEVMGQREGIRRKPAPDIPLALAQKMGVLPDECLYIGDTGTDMRTGRNAGMLTVGVLWGFRDKEELLLNGAAVLAEHPEELLEICENVIRNGEEYDQTCGQ